MTDALGHIRAGAIARDVRRVVRVPSVTGSERAAAGAIVALAHELDLDAELVEFDLRAIRRRRLRR